MKLMTKTLENRFRKFPLYSQDGKLMDAIVVVKYFNPCGAQTWLVTEGEKLPDGDWRFFCYYYDETGGEWGYVHLSQLQSIRLPFGLGIEREYYTSPMATVGELVR